MKTARWRLVDDAGNQIDPGHVPEPWGTQEEAAKHLAWLVPALAARGEAWVFAHLIRVDLMNIRPGLSRASRADVADAASAPDRKETA